MHVADFSKGMMSRERGSSPNMPLCVVLENLHHKRIEEAFPAEGALNRLLPLGDESFPMLGCVDEYGRHDLQWLANESAHFRMAPSDFERCTSGNARILGEVSSDGGARQTRTHIFIRLVGD